MADYRANQGGVDGQGEDWRIDGGSRNSASTRGKMESDGKRRRIMSVKVQDYDLAEIVGNRSLAILFGRFGMVQNKNERARSERRPIAKT